MLSDLPCPAVGAAGPAAGGGAGAAAAVPPAWSPRGLASATAAAGLLSPRAVPGGAAAGSMGLPQQQQQVQELPSRQQSSPLTVGSSAASVLDAPEVQIQHSVQWNYWLVEIKCRDRNKLFFDTVCE